MYIPFSSGQKAVFKIFYFSPIDMILQLKFFRKQFLLQNPTKFECVTIFQNEITMHYFVLVFIFISPLYIASTFTLIPSSTYIVPSFYSLQDTGQQHKCNFRFCKTGAYFWNRISYTLYAHAHITLVRTYYTSHGIRALWVFLSKIQILIGSDLGLDASQSLSLTPLTHQTKNVYN